MPPDEAHRRSRVIVFFLRQLIGRFIDNRVPDLSAQLAFYFMLSLFPFLIFAVTVLSYTVTAEDVLEIISRYVPSEAMEPIERNVRDVLSGRSGKWLSFSILATLWPASHATNALISSLNEAYDVEESRPFWKARGMAIMLTLALIGVLLIALTLPVFGRTIGWLIFSLFGWSHAFFSIWDTLRWSLSFLLLFAVFLFLYRVAPNKRLGLMDSIFGALFATVSWQLASLVFSYFVSQFGNYSATYGGLAGVVILMVWFYVTGMIMLIGGEINATLHDMKRKSIR